MSRTLFIAGGLILALITAVLGAGLFYYTTFERVVTWDGEAETYQDIVDGWADQKAIPGVILSVDVRGERLYHGAAGRTQKSGGSALTPDTPFHTASVGKLFTAVTVLRLVEDGRLALDQPVSELLAEDIYTGLVVIEGQDRSGSMTVGQLLSHRAGLGNTDDNLAFGLSVLFQPGRHRTPDDLLDAARAVPPVARPGEVTAYASPGYFLLGRIIEAVTGQAYHEAVRAYVFTPAGMDHTFEASQEWTGERTVLHHYVGWVDLAQADPSFEFADGGFVTTAEDMIRFGRALIDGTLLSSDSLRQIYNPDFAPARNIEDGSHYFQSYGPVVSFPEGDPYFIYHGGYWGVFFIVYPQEETIAIMTLAQANVSIGRFWSHVRHQLEPVFEAHRQERMRANASAHD